MVEMAQILWKLCESFGHFRQVETKILWKEAKHGPNPAQKCSQQGPDHWILYGTVLLAPHDYLVKI